MPCPAERLGEPPTRVQASFDGLVDRGILTFLPAERGAAFRIVDAEVPLSLDRERWQVKRSAAFAKLNRMEAYTRSDCRRRDILAYFGEEAAFERCGERIHPLGEYDYMGKVYTGSQLATLWRVPQQAQPQRRRAKRMKAMRLEE